jgi:hypothetical protein
MTHRVKRPPLKLVLCQNSEMCICAGISSDNLKDWRIRGILPRGIYWTTMPDSDRILWVRDMVLDYIINGDSPAHQKAVERYLSSLPSSDNYNPTAA